MDLTGLNFNWQLDYFWKMNWNEQTQTVQHGAGQPLAYGIFERGLAGPWFVIVAASFFPFMPLSHKSWQHTFSSLQVLPVAGYDRAFFFPHCPHLPPLFVGDRAEHPVSEHGISVASYVP